MPPARLLVVLVLFVPVIFRDLMYDRRCKEHETARRDADANAEIE